VRWGSWLLWICLRGGWASSVWVSAVLGLSGLGLGCLLLLWGPGGAGWGAGGGACCGVVCWGCCCWFWGVLLGWLLGGLGALWGWAVACWGCGALCLLPVWSGCIWDIWGWGAGLWGAGAVLSVWGVAVLAALCGLCVGSVRLVLGLWGFAASGGCCAAAAGLGGWGSAGGWCLFCCLLLGVWLVGAVWGVPG